MSTAKDRWKECTMEAAEKAAEVLLPQPVGMDRHEPLPLWRSVELITKAGGVIRFEQFDEKQTAIWVEFGGERYGRACECDYLETAFPILLHNFCLDHL